MIYQFAPQIKEADNHQTKIGWDHFVRGRIAITWGNLVNKYQIARTRNY